LQNAGWSDDFLHVKSMCPSGICDGLFSKRSTGQPNDFALAELIAAKRPVGSPRRRGL
jgi:hypothetical protein